MRAMTACTAGALASLLAVAPGERGGRARAPQESALEGPQLPVTTVLSDQYGGPEEPRRAVITSAAEWTAFWGGGAAPGLAGVDFARDMVIAVALGTRPTGGHSVTVESARREGRRLLVTVREVSPGAGCVVSQALTSPVVAVRIPRSSEPVEFVVVQERRDCPP